MLINLAILVAAGVLAAVLAGHSAAADIARSRSLPVAPGLRKVDASALSAVPHVRTCRGLSAAR